MAQEQYLIVRQNNEWKISFNEKLYGPYGSQEEAIEAAVDAAYAMGEIGIEAQVLLRASDDTVKTAWSYGQDFHLYGR